MLERISLRGRILLIVGTLLVLTLGNCLAVVWLNCRTMSVVSVIADEDLAGLKTARGMEIALALQRGFLASYLLDGDGGWMDQLDERRRDFQGWLKNARSKTRGGDQHEILNEIETMAIRYGHSQDRSIDLYSTGDREASIRQHKDLSKGFLDIRELCDRYWNMHEGDIALAGAAMEFRGRTVNAIAIVLLSVATVLGVVLVYVLLTGILQPIRALAAALDPDGGNARAMNEVKALTRGVSGLMEDVDEKRTQLELSRERLLQSEKLAMVGKLAASVAHTIRNPLTSVKMRLFSLERSLDLAPTEKEDFEVISEEIRHIDTIVQNFLEFSRPPKLKMQKISPSDVVDMAIQLLRRRIESYGVTLELFRQRKLSKIEADPEQLKEVLVNLIINACEAMGEGGTIEIREEEGKTEPMGHVAVIRVIDNGPGMPESIREKVFQPFFSTKEEGTGLGLSIAARIIEDHHGCLNLRSREGKGTTFTITIPCVEEGAWLRS